MYPFNQCNIDNEGNISKRHKCIPKEERGYFIYSHRNNSKVHDMGVFEFLFAHTCTYINQIMWQPQGGNNLKMNIMDVFNMLITYKGYT
jgi:hypothetical protein